MKNILLTIFLLTYTCLPCFCQQTVDEAWVASINEEYAAFPSELIYLQTSKGIYETGEDLWFKAYQLNSQSFAFSNQSQTLYLQMINNKDSIVWQEKYPVENGMVFGHVYVGEKLADGNGVPVKTNLGLSVFDKAYINPADPVNILTHCYLSSQIRGKIHNPLYYFDEKNKDRMQAMDLLLLTQGWRRYVWNIEYAPDNENLFLSDEIIGIQSIHSKKKRKEAQGTEQLIQISGAEGNSLYVWADSTGSFTVGTDILKELRGGYVYLKPMLSNEHKPQLEIEDYFPQIDSLRKKKQRYYPIMDISQSVKEQTLDMPVVSNDSTILLDEVVVTRKASRPFRDKFMGRLDSLAQMDIGMPWVCPDGHLENYKDGYTVHHDPRYCPNANIVPLEERSKPVEGKTYRIIKPKYFDGGKWFIVEDEQYVVYHGPIYSEEELLRRNNLWRAKGYYAAREFYQPDEIDMQLSTPDARNTLLWQPSVITDEKGEAEVSFYCSDINTGFVGIAEGVDGMGLLGTGKCEFGVVRNFN